MSMQLLRDAEEKDERDAVWVRGLKPERVGRGGNKRMADGLTLISDGMRRAVDEGRSAEIWTQHLGGRDPETGRFMDWLLPGSAATLNAHLDRIVYDDNSYVDGWRACAALCVMARRRLGEIYIGNLTFDIVCALIESVPLARALVERGLLRGDIYDLNDARRKNARESYMIMWRIVDAVNNNFMATATGLSGWCAAAAAYLELFWDGSESAGAPFISNRLKAAAPGG